MCRFLCVYRICILIAPPTSGDLLAQLVEHRIPEISRFEEDTPEGRWFKSAIDHFFVAEEDKEGRAIGEELLLVQVGAF